MLAELVRLRDEFGFAIQLVDVDGDPALVTRYGNRVPVLAAEDRELCHLELDESALRSYFSELGSGS